MRKAIVYASVHHGITLIFEQKENRGFYSSVFRLLCFSLQLEKYSRRYGDGADVDIKTNQPHG